MDDEINVSQEDIQRLSMAEKQQLQMFIQTESQKSNIQKTVHELTETCFKKCITGSISSGKLASKEEACMANCVNRFMDSSLAMLKHLELLRAQQ
ncbi:Mitochondrial import inner membrane translocase subunit tim8 [Exophiala xenobiotica]|nr:Mitochondrial import inner membrane translocase subunit tim8 [Exophiala xenobiotica]